MDWCHAVARDAWLLLRIISNTSIMSLCEYLIWLQIVYVHILMKTFNSQNAEKQKNK